MDAEIRYSRRHLLASGIAFATIAACTKPAEVIGIDNPSYPALATPGARPVKVFVATSRATSNVPGELFSAERADFLSLAHVTVTVPPNHTPGTFERARRAPPDPRIHFTAVDPVIYPDDASFVRDINKTLAARPKTGTSRDILLFVHGFNTRLSDAVMRIGQFVTDSGFQGIPVLFSWASAGKFNSYVYDLNSTLIARPMLEETSQLLTQTNATGFDVFAHSMGSLLVTEVMVQSDLQNTLGSSGKLRNVMLAAPDIDIDLFRSQLGQIRNNPGQIYLLIDEEDNALRVSEFVAGAERVGRADVRDLDGLGVAVIDITGSIGTERNVHRRYANAPEIVRLIGQGMQTYGFRERNQETILLEFDKLFD